MKSSIDKFITKSLSMPTSFFVYSLESIIDEQISDVRESLQNESLLRVESDLMAEIESTLKNIYQKPNIFTQFFYNILGLDRDIEGYKRKLKYLLDKLRTDASRVDIDMRENRDHIQKIEEILDYLKELKEKILIKDKNKLLIKEIKDKIQLLEKYNIALSLREINLLEIKKIYKKIEIKGYEL